MAFAGSSYGKYGAASDCNMACNGKASEICGGTWANDVYATNVQQLAAAPSARRWWYSADRRQRHVLTLAQRSGRRGLGQHRRLADARLPEALERVHLKPPSSDDVGGGDAGPIIQAALDAGHTELVIPGSGSFGSPHQYKIATQVNVPAGAIIECQEGAQFLDPTACTASMPGLFVLEQRRTASVTGAGILYGFACSREPRSAPATRRLTTTSSFG